MLRIFQSSNPFTIVLFLILTASLNFHYFTDPVLFDVDVLTPVAKFFLLDIIHADNIRIEILIIVHIILVALQGALISLLVRSYKILPKASLVPAVIFVTL